MRTAEETLNRRRKIGTNELLLLLLFGPRTGVFPRSLKTPGGAERDGAERDGRRATGTGINLSLKWEQRPVRVPAGATNGGVLCTRRAPLARQSQDLSAASANRADGGGYAFPRGI